MWDGFVWNARIVQLRWQQKGLPEVERRTSREAVRAKPSPKMKAKSATQPFGPLNIRFQWAHSHLPIRLRSHQFKGSGKGPTKIRVFPIYQPYRAGLQLSTRGLSGLPQSRAARKTVFPPGTQTTFTRSRGVRRVWSSRHSPLPSC